MLNVKKFNMTSFFHYSAKKFLWDSTLARYSASGFHLYTKTGISFSILLPTRKSKQNWITSIGYLHTKFEVFSMSLVLKYSRTEKERKKVLFLWLWSNVQRMYYTPTCRDLALNVVGNNWTRFLNNKPKNLSLDTLAPPISPYKTQRPSTAMLARFWSTLDPPTGSKMMSTPCSD